MATRYFNLNVDPSRSVDRVSDLFNLIVTEIPAYDSSGMANRVQYDIRIDINASKFNEYRQQNWDIEWHIPHVGSQISPATNYDGAKRINVTDYSQNRIGAIIIPNVTEENLVDFGDDELVVKLTNPIIPSDYVTFTSGPRGEVYFGEATNISITTVYDPGISSNIVSGTTADFKSQTPFEPFYTGEYDYTEYKIFVDGGTYEDGNIIARYSDITVYVYGFFTVHYSLSEGANISITDDKSIAYMDGDLIRYGDKIYITVSPYRGYIISTMTIDGAEWDYNVTKIISSYTKTVSVVVAAAPKYTVRIGHSGTFDNKYAIFIYRNHEWGLYRPLIYKDGEWGEYE